MKWKIIIVLLILLGVNNMVLAAKTNSENYINNIDITSGSDSLSSNNYSTILLLDEFNDFISSSNYRSGLGFMYTLSASQTIETTPSTTTNILLASYSPFNNYVSSSPTVNFIYNITNTSSNNINCSLIFGGESVTSEIRSSDGLYTITYYTGQGSGSNYWYISCEDPESDITNSSIRTINFQISSSGGGADTGFRFINLNQFGSSYIHRSDNLPAPDQKVEFTVYLSDYNPSDNVIFYYSEDNKQTWYNKTMIYDEKTDSYNTQIGGYDPKSVIFYYVEAYRSTTMILTPDTYDVIIWDNPPSSGQSNSIVIIIAIFVIALISISKNNNHKKNE